MKDETKVALATGCAGGMLYLAGYCHAKFVEPLIDALWWKHQTKKADRQHREFCKEYDAKYGANLTAKYEEMLKEQGIDI